MLLFGFKPILIIAAIIPAIALMSYVYKTDKLDKESPRLMSILVKQGILSTFLALLTESAGTFLLGLRFDESSLAYSLISNFIIVALSEEGFKYLVMKRKTWNSPEFNCRFDGVVYSVFVSLGFALWENIGYVIKYGFYNAIVRAVTAVPGHACFGVFMGAWYGLAKKYDNLGDRSASRTLRLVSVIIPVLLHGTYDFLAGIESEMWTLAFIPFVGAMFVLAFIMLKKLSYNDSYIE